MQAIRLKFKKNPAHKTLTSQDKTELRKWGLTGVGLHQHRAYKGIGGSGRLLGGRIGERAPGELRLACSEELGGCRNAQRGRHRWINVADWNRNSQQSTGHDGGAPAPLVARHREMLQRSPLDKGCPNRHCTSNRHYLPQAYIPLSEIYIIRRQCRF
jgi:hypothetical protein